jgi:uncharacterized protein YbbK (DUF523 family)
MDTLKIGISACLAGQPVRYDGGHKLDPFLADTLGRFLSFVPVCPEAECGLGVPRETMRLVGDPAAPRLVTTGSAQDRTRLLADWASQRVAELAREGICGFILKARSPSCAVTDAPICAADGTPLATGAGLFTRALMAALPQLPLADENRLRDPAFREAFLARLRHQER